MKRLVLLYAAAALALGLSACGGSTDPQTAGTCEESIEILFNNMEEYLEVVADVSPSESPTDAAIEAQETVEGKVDGMQTRISELECDSDDLSPIYCESLENLDTGAYGRQWLEAAGIPTDCEDLN